MLSLNIWRGAALIYVKGTAESRAALAARKSSCRKLNLLQISALGPEKLHRERNCTLHLSLDVKKPNPILRRSRATQCAAFVDAAPGDRTTPATPSVVVYHGCPRSVLVADVRGVAQRDELIMSIDCNWADVVIE
jgi:hypothetical protein